ncbi:MAG: stage 0 sporulation protein [Erysipelotrichia bacterium]|nr:stage 0 sporulation protein [Erysipelotrichia bacterium]
MPKTQNNTTNPTTNEYTHFVGVKFTNTPRAYFFGTQDKNYEIGEFVVVETVRGLELGTISVGPTPIEKYSTGLYLKPIIHKATDNDIRRDKKNQMDAVLAMDICRAEVKKLNLKMNLITCEYTLDKAKVLFSYLADERVDFRELLKVLAARLHTRIELRQIGARDKAKMIGGLGVCGLTLCCSTFLNEFDGISINRAKNQMLAINIPKLSGQCGKLICCLKYEDDAYTEKKKEFPELGSRLFIDKVSHVVTGINILSRMVKIESEDAVKFISLDELKKQTRFPRRRDSKNEKK